MRLPLLFQTAFTYNGEKWRTGTAFRCTLGVALPLLLALWSGHAAWGVLASTGALNAGLASFNGVTRRRLRVMLGTSLTMSLVTVLALLVGGNTAVTVLAVTLVAWAMTLYGGLGPAATTIGIQAITTTTVISGLHLPASLAWPGGGLVLAGGLVQTLLLTFVWPAGRHHPERRAVRRVYRRLEQLLGRLPVSGDLLAEAAPFQEAWDVLDEARRFRWRPEHARLRQALRVAEGLRAALVGYARADQEARRRGGTVRADAMAAALLETLGEIGAEVGQGEASLTPAACTTLGQALRGLEGEATRPLHYWAGLMVRLLNDLQAEPPGGPPPRPAASPFQATLQTLRGNALLSAATGRHALKYALALGLTTLVMRLGQVPHGYWLTLTVGVVLKPDYVTTLTRGVARLGGTLLGVVISALLIWAFHPGERAVLFALGATWLVYALFLTSYALFSAAITVYVVMLLVASGVAEGAAAGQRLLFTLLGGAVALGVYRLWPDWQSRQVVPVLTNAARAQLAYLQAVTALWQGGDPEAAAGARDRARRLRVQAENLVRAAHLEPSLAGPANSSALSLTWAEDALLRLNASAALGLSLHAEALQPAVPAEHAGRLDRARGELAQVIQEARHLCGELERSPAATRPA